jgi:uncharacterized protein (DUF433 family)
MPELGRRFPIPPFPGLALSGDIATLSAMTRLDRITIEPGKRGGRPCVRGMRIAVEDVLGWLAAGQSNEEIIVDYPELSRDDILACLEFAARREHLFVSAA